MFESSALRITLAPHVVKKSATLRFGDGTVGADEQQAAQQEYHCVLSKNGVKDSAGLETKHSCIRKR